ncbi:MAG TPA: molybdate ABC transporter substrate-binding protein [Nitrospiraceae bacterium]|jgi:molybdate transport system substrate-binding protein|nr:molybdate ABC transporter substrate-binding protein [Nitrospiraceae bacterium]
MVRKLFALSLGLIWASGISVDIVSAENQGEITVSAAISLKNAFEEVGKIYEAKGGSAKVLFNFGASGDLARQIEGGAPVDVFASAAQKDMDDLDNKGVILQGSRFNFAANRVVLIVPVGSKIAAASFEGLADREVKKIAMGNPKTVPAGRYAEEVLAYYKLPPSIKEKLVFAENVRQVLDYVARGEVDAGIVYATDASTRAKEVRIVASAPEESHKPVVYSIAVLKDAKNEVAAKAFVALVLSPEGQRILEKYGFRKP